MENYSDIYRITSHPSQNRIIVKVFGHFTNEAHEHFKTNIANMVKSQCIGGNKVDMLFDLIDGKTQSKEVAQDNLWMMALAPYVNKVATAVESVIYKMQLQRIELQGGMKFFDTVESAGHWLDEAT